MGLKAVVQALQKAEILKEKLQFCRDLLNDNDAWACQQQLQKIYQQVLILDLEYALDKKVEQDLWNHGFKHYIAAIQKQTKDKKNPKRAEFQALLSWCLDTASGFYLMLLQEICTAFNLDLPFRRKAQTLGNLKSVKPSPYISQPQKNSCHYLCQYCLVHLGDLARYRSASRQAEAFYKHAVQLSPSSGQPYNQLALLETSRGDKLSTVFHYIRSVAVAHPFPAAASNISLTLEKCLETQFAVDGKNKLSSSEYVSLFLKLHAVFHLAADFPQSEVLVRILTSSLTSHVATEAFSSWKLVQMMVINMFSMHHLTSEGIQTLTADEKIVRSLLLDHIAGSLNAFLLSVYMLKQDSLIDYFALPVVKLTLDYLKLDPQLICESGFVSRPQIWPSLAKLLNSLQPSLNDFNSKLYSSTPLPEDRDLQGFIPLEAAFSGLIFSDRIYQSNAAKMNKLRASRLVDFGLWLANSDLNLLSTRKEEGGAIIFETPSTQFQPSAELLQELKELRTNKLITPISLSPSSVTPTPPELIENNLVRRSGILKSSNLKKSGNDESKGKGRQNIAMQAILRKNVEHENKQVKFKTPSPTCSIASQPDWCPTPFANAPDTCRSSLQSTFFDRSHFPMNSPSPSSPLPSPSPPAPPPNCPPTSYQAKFHPHHPPPPQNQAHQSFTFQNPHSKFFPPIQAPSINAKAQPMTPLVFSPQLQDQFNPWNGSGAGGSLWFNSEEKEGPMLMEHVQNSNHQYSDHNLICRPPPHDERRSVPSGQEFFRNGTWEPPRPVTVYPEMGHHNNQTGEQHHQGNASQPNTYSLFSPVWAQQPAMNEQREAQPSESALNMALLAHQSLWSGPGPSPLERLLEQQKQLRNPK